MVVEVGEWKRGIVALGVVFVRSGGMVAGFDQLPGAGAERQQRRHKGFEIGGGVVHRWGRIVASADPRMGRRNDRIRA